MINPLAHPLNYPFPDLINPFADKAREEVNYWLDTSYSFLSEEIRKKYKKVNFAYAVARSCPTAISYDHFRECVRGTMVLTMFDDYHELCTEEEFIFFRERFIHMLQGGTPTGKDSGFFHQAAFHKSHLLTFMPSTWLDRYIRYIDRFLGGVQSELAYLHAKRFPLLSDYMAFREYSVGGEWYRGLAEIELGFPVPDHIESHPHIMRICALLARLIAWQNDFYSLYKDQTRGDTMNLILIIQHEHNISFEEAYKEALRIHDEDLAEFVALQENCPDFGTSQADIKTYMNHLGMILQGYNSYYRKDTARYSPDGYPESEYKRIKQER